MLCVFWNDIVIKQYLLKIFIPFKLQFSYICRSDRWCLWALFCRSEGLTLLLNFCVQSWEIWRYPLNQHVCSNLQSQKMEKTCVWLLVRANRPDCVGEKQEKQFSLDNEKQVTRNLTIILLNTGSHQWITLPVKTKACLSLGNQKKSKNKKHLIVRMSIE